MSISSIPAEPLTVRRIAARSSAGEMVLRRWAGCWIDLLVLGAIVVGPYLAMGPNAPAAVGWLVGLAGLGYFPLTETLWGRSAGKFVTGLMIVDEHGDKPGIVRVIIRTLFRLVEVNPMLFGGVPAGICVALTAHRQRLGDLAAGTYVIHRDDVRRISKHVEPEAAKIFE